MHSPARSTLYPFPRRKPGVRALAPTQRRGTWRERDDGMLHFDWDTRLVQYMLNGPPLPDIWRLFRSLRRVPALALRGENSDILDRETFQRMAAEHEGLMQVEVNRTGHTPSLNEPESVHAIDAFLKTL